MFKNTILRVGMLLLSLMCTIPSFSQEKTALIIAIGDYPEDGGWMKISSGNDVPLVKEALMNQGFTEQNIFVLQDADATHDGIMQAIQTQLADKVAKGGIAYFHYSGHGQQVADNNGDEADGYDEAIVPYDSPMRYVEGVYEGENLIRDEDLGAAFDQVRQKLGPTGNFLAVIDACHSGTGTRGMALARGTQTKMAPEGFAPPANRGAPETNAMESVQNSNSAPMVAFFGAAPHQLNFETKDEEGHGVGSLSYAFSKKFSVAEKHTSYRMLFDQIKLDMSTTAPRQQPQAEGLLDQEILAGNLVDRIEYYQVTFNHDGTSLVMDAGWLQGVKEGSKIGVFSAETMAHGDQEPLATGYVQTSRAMECNVQLEKPFDVENKNGYLAVVLEPGFGNVRVNVKLDLPNNPQALEAIRSKMAEVPILQENEEADLFVISDRGNIELMTKDDYLLLAKESRSAPRSVAHSFVRKMVSYAQAMFLRDMELSSYRMPVEFEILPVKYDAESNKVVGNIDLETKTDAAGNLHFEQGDYLQIRVTNLGDKNAYYTLLDIQPDNEINILIPEAKEMPGDFQIGPGESRIVEKVFGIGPPAGTEVFKLIATDEAIDLRSIVVSRGNGSKNPNPNPFERLFADSYFNENTGTRGTRVLNLGSSNVNVFSKVFIIDKINQ